MKRGYNVAIAAIGIILVIVALIFYFRSYQIPASSSNNVIISLTDPANVPYGTQSLNIAYSSLSIHTINRNSSGWVNTSTSGQVNLLSLVNSSITLSSLSLSNNTEIDMLKLNVSSASITINNTVYPVILPSNQLTVNVNGTRIVNGTVKVLIDLSPTIITVVTANSTIFIMVPSLKAIIVPHPSNTNKKVGVISKLSDKDKAELDDITPKISIATSSLITKNNITTFSVTVNDNSNRSVLIKHILIFGNESVYVTKFGKIIRSGDNKESIDISNNSSKHSINASLEVVENKSIGIGEDLAFMRTINFLVSTNGTLYLPYLKCTSNQNNNDNGDKCVGETEYSDFEKGFTINPGQNFTFTFNGTIVVGNGNYLINPIIGNNYTVVVQGENDARANTNVIAKG